MGLADKLKGLKKDDYDKANSQAGTYLGGKDGQTGTDLAQEKYKLYQAGKASGATGSTTGDKSTASGTSGHGAGQTGTGAGYETKGSSSYRADSSTTTSGSGHHGPTPTGGYDSKPTGGSTTGAVGAGYGSSTSSTDHGSSSHSKKHGESPNHPGLLAKFETGVHHLDAKIAKLPEHIQKEAHKSFQKGYDDAKKAFKH
ncbi:hypothetical protein Cantr_10016 [Candida viswanathii]|uniref:Uncharacterized protein n=1 Tax=Candida viswanathii TaxID=5486 RepID=A0A367YB56_9ASCO|nr:hypothetical protein Cantr_10016 [Candida viswanathii]